MALFPRPLLTIGATHSAQQFRMMVRDLANGAEGNTQLLRVRANAVNAGQAGRIYVDSGTTLVADVQFEEAPR